MPAMEHFFVARAANGVTRDRPGIRVAPRLGVSLDRQSSSDVVVSLRKPIVTSLVALPSMTLLSLLFVDWPKRTY